MKFATAAANSLTWTLAQGFPLELLKGAGLLSGEEIAHYEAVEKDAKLVDKLIARGADRRLDSNVQEKRSTFGLLDLPLGDGLLDGVLQPLTGAIAKLDIPTPQVITLKKIPGDDPGHQFIAPGPTDVRGICPTLNALANHGYLSRSGITTFAEASNAVIGGADAQVPNTLGPALGLDKHGVFEIDGFITRQDVHFGNNANFIEQRWEEYVNISRKHGGEFGPEAQAEDVGYRYNNSRATNPSFYAGAIWSGVSHAERVFVYEALPNGTARGVADHANVAPFFLNETFPDDWYRRGQAFTIVSAFEEAFSVALSNFRPLGSNHGLNKFVPLELDINEFTPAALGCFSIKNIFDLAPGQISGNVDKFRDLYEGFVKGTIANFFVGDGYFNCDIGPFVNPSAPAGVAQNGSVSSSGSPIIGVYPGIGFIQPDSQPS